MIILPAMKPPTLPVKGFGPGRLSLPSLLDDPADSLQNERKFTAHSLDADRALILIRHYCRPHPTYYRGRVSSIYFDTPNLAAYKEKIDGDTLKRKYRLRWYDVAEARDRETITAFLEIKYRIGSARDKLRQVLQVRQSWLESVGLRDPELVSFLYRYAADCADNIPLNLCPVVCISYDRYRFLCPRSGLTVCVDFNIQATRINANLLCAPVPFGLNTVVCECKGTGFPEIPLARGLYHAGFRIRSFSKYGECLNQAQLGGAPTVKRMSI